MYLNIETNKFISNFLMKICCIYLLKYWNKFILNEIYKKNRSIRCIFY